MYIEINPANNFIRSSKSYRDIPIFFVSKLDRNLCLCVDYQDLNNLTIRNRYPLSLMGKSLD